MTDFMGSAHCSMNFIVFVKLDDGGGEGGGQDLYFRKNVSVF